MSSSVHGEIEASLITPITQSFSLLTEPDWQGAIRSAANASCSSSDTSDETLLEAAMTLSTGLTCFIVERVFNFFAKLGEASSKLSKTIASAVAESQTGDNESVSVRFLGDAIDVTISVVRLRRLLAATVIVPYLQYETERESTSFANKSVSFLPPTNGALQKHEETEEPDNQEVLARRTPSLSRGSQSQNSSDGSTEEVSIASGVAPIDFLTFWKITELCITITLSDDESPELVTTAEVPIRLAKFRDTLLRILYEVPENVSLASVLESGTIDFQAKKNESIRQDEIALALESASTMRQKERTDQSDWVEFSKMFGAATIEPTLYQIGSVVYTWLTYRSSPLVQVAFSELQSGRQGIAHEGWNSQKSEVFVKRSTLQSQLGLRFDNLFPLGSNEELPDGKAGHQSHRSTVFMTARGEGHWNQSQQIKRSPSKRTYTEVSIGNELSTMTPAELGDLAERLIESLLAEEESRDKRRSTDHVDTMSLLVDVIREVVYQTERVNKEKTQDSLKRKLEVAELKNKSLIAEAKDQEERLEQLYEKLTEATVKINKAEANLKFSTTEIRRLESEVEKVNEENVCDAN